MKTGNSEAVSTLGSLVSPPTLVKEVQLGFSAILCNTPQALGPRAEPEDSR